MPVKKKEVKPVVYNDTAFPLERVKTFRYLGETVNEWRQRNISLYQHPEQPDAVVSVGTTFSGDMIVICEEPKASWRVALDYIAHGKVYVSE